MFNVGRVQGISAVLLVSAMFALTAGCNRDPNVRKQKYLESGKRYEAAGKYKEAAIQFSNALKIDKNFGDAHYEMAKTYEKLNSQQPAYWELMKTVELSPANLAARIDLGDMLLAGRATDRAEEQARAVLAINPNYADAYALLAGVAQRRGDNTGALQQIQRALQIDPSQAKYHTAEALLLTASPGNEVQTEAELGKAASLDSKDATPHLVLAELLVKKGDLQGAEQQYLTAVKIAPENLTVRVALAGLYLREGSKDRAEQALHQAVTDLPDNEQAAVVLKDFYARTGQADRAEPVFADLTAKYPKSVAIKLAYARVLFEKRNLSKAQTVAAELTKNNAGNPEVQTLNALLLLNTGKPDEAFNLLQKAVKDNPSNAQTHILLAQVSLGKNDLGTAETNFQGALKLNPGSMEAAAGLAQVAIRRNDAGALSDIAEKTIQVHPEQADPYLWRGTAETSRKEFDKAAADYQTALQKSPDNPVALLALGELRLIQGKAPEGTALVQKSLDKDPNSLRALAILVSYDMKAKQPAKALQRVQAQIAKSPSNGGIYLEMASLQLQLRDFKGALDSSQRAMQLSPANSNAIDAYARAAVGAGQVDSAISAWQNWENSHPSDAHGLEVLGSLEEVKGDPAKATDFFKKAVQLDPNNARATNDLAYLMVESGQNVDVALTLAQTARRLLPDSPQTADTLAWVYYYKGSYGSARDLLEGALKSTPDDAAMQFHLGMTYSKLNDKADAILHLKKAVALDPSSKNARDAAVELAKLG